MRKILFPYSSIAAAALILAGFSGNGTSGTLPAKAGPGIPDILEVCRGIISRLGRYYADKPESP